MYPYNIRLLVNLGVIRTRGGQSGAFVAYVTFPSSEIAWITRELFCQVPSGQWFAIWEAKRGCKLGLD